MEEGGAVGSRCGRQETPFDYDPHPFAACQLSRDGSDRVAGNKRLCTLADLSEHRRSPSCPQNIVVIGRERHLADEIDLLVIDDTGSDEVGSTQLVEIIIAHFTNRRPVFERFDHIHRADNTASLNLPAHVGWQAIANDPLERPASCFIRANVERSNRVCQVCHGV